MQEEKNILEQISEKLDLIYQNTVRKDAPFLDLKQASLYLNISPNTLYQFTCTRRNSIPFYKRGRKIYFDKSELDAWILDRKNRNKTNEEIEFEAATRTILKK